MKKFLLFFFISFTILGAILAYILYNEGAFRSIETKAKPTGELKPFVMKCESGKCGEGKCGSK